MKPWINLELPVLAGIMVFWVFLIVLAIVLATDNKTHAIDRFKHFVQKMHDKHHKT